MRMIKAKTSTTRLCIVGGGGDGMQFWRLATLQGIQPKPARNMPLDIHVRCVKFTQKALSPRIVRILGEINHNNRG